MRWQKEIFLLFSILFLTVLSVNLYSDSYQQYQETIKLKKLYKQGKSFFNAGNYSVAIPFFQDILTNKNIPPKALSYVYYYLGESYFKIHLYSKSREMFNKLLKLDYVPNKRNLYKRLIEISYMIDVPDKFLIFAKSNISNVSMADVSECYYLTGKTYLINKKYSLAVSDFSKIEKDFIWYDNAKYYLGYAYLGSKKSDQTEEIWSTLPSNYKDIETVFFNLAVLKQDKGMYSQAEEYYEKITAGSSYQDKILYNRAWIKIFNQDLDGALEMLKLLISRYPESKLLPEVANIVGYIFLAKDDFQGAFVYFNKNIVIFKNYEQQLSLYRQTHGESNKFYNDLVKPAPNSITLPVVIRKWILDDKKIKKSNLYIDEVEKIKLLISDIKSTLNDFAIKSLSPDISNKSPAHMDMQTLENVYTQLLPLLDKLMKIKGLSVFNYMWGSEKLILDRIRLLRRSLISLEGYPDNVIENVYKKHQEIKKIREYMLQINPKAIEGKDVVNINKDNLKLTIPYSTQVLEKFSMEDGILVQMMFNSYILNEWIKESIEYSYRLENRMIDLVLLRLGVYHNRNYRFFYQIDEVFQDGIGILNLILNIKKNVDKIERKAFIDYYSYSVSEGANLSDIFAQLDYLKKELYVYRGWQARKNLVNLNNKLHDYRVRFNAGVINVAWNSKKKDDQLALSLLDEKQRKIEELNKYYKWAVAPIKEKVSKDRLKKDLADYYELLTKSSKKDSVYNKHIRDMGDMVTQLLEQYYKINEVIKRLQKKPFEDQ